MTMTENFSIGQNLNITPMTWDLPQRQKASNLARDLGAGVRMEVASSATRYYADWAIPVGQIDVYMARSYKGQLEYATRLHGPEAFFDAWGFTWEDEDGDDDD